MGEDVALVSGGSAFGRLDASDSSVRSDSDAGSAFSGSAFSELSEESMFSSFGAFGVEVSEVEVSEISDVKTGDSSCARAFPDEAPSIPLQKLSHRIVINAECW